MRWSQALFFVLTALTGVVANLEISGVESSYDASSGDTYTISWSDDGTGDTVPVDDVQTVTLLLCTYDDDDAVKCISSSSGMLSSYEVDGDTSASFTFTSTQSSWGVDGYGYYFQLTAVVSSKEYYQCYSDFITMEGMTGVEGTNVSPSTGPGSVPAATGDQGQALSAADISSLASVTYTAQTLRTRVAAMQMQPGTKVTLAMSPSRRYPTSAVSLFSTSIPSPSVVTTLTISWSYTFTPYINYASTKSAPTLVKDPTAVRQSYIAQVTKAANAKRRRWQD